MLGELLSVCRRIFELRPNLLKLSQKQPFSLKVGLCTSFDHCAFFVVFIFASTLMTDLETDLDL